MPWNLSNFGVLSSNVPEPCPLVSEWEHAVTSSASTRLRDHIVSLRLRHSRQRLFVFLTTPFQAIVLDSGSPCGREESVEFGAVKSSQGTNSPTVPKMSSTSLPNTYSSIAEEWQILSDLTEEVELYYENVQFVISKPKNKGAGPQEKYFVTTHRTLEELLSTPDEKREESQTFRRKYSSTLRRSGKGIVDTLE